MCLSLLTSLALVVVDLVVDLVYGDAVLALLLLLANSSSNANGIRNDANYGDSCEAIDVRVPIQCLVEEHTR